MPVLAAVTAAGAAVATIGVAAAAFVGAMAGLAWMVAAATGARLTVRAVSRRRRSRALTELAAALRMLVRELRSGASPAAACSGVAASVSGAGRAALIRVAPTRRPATGSGPVTAPAAGPADATVDDVVRRLQQGLLLAERYGVPWAEVVAAVGVDIEARAKADAALAVEAAGPQLSGYVLGALPILGLALGAGMGADPVRVLFGTQVGQLLLLAGTVLTCAGLLWATRIATPAGPGRLR